MKLSKTTLITSALVSLLIMSQAATAGQAPAEVAVFGNADSVQSQYSESRVNYSITEADVNNNASDLFPENER